MLGDFTFHIPFKSNYYPIFSCILGVFCMIYDFIGETKKANFKFDKFSIFTFIFIFSLFVIPHFYYYHLCFNDKLIWSYWRLVQDISILLGLYFVINSMEFLDNDCLLILPASLFIYCIIFYVSFFFLFFLNLIFRGSSIEIILGLYALIFCVFYIKNMLSKNQQSHEEIEV
jgi:hypothetical protein